MQDTGEPNPLIVLEGGGGWCTTVFSIGKGIGNNMLNMIRTNLPNDMDHPENRKRDRIQNVTTTGI